jgi:hypothetical protein
MVIPDPKNPTWRRYFSFIETIASAPCRSPGTRETSRISPLLIGKTDIPRQARIEGIPCPQATKSDSIA